MCLRDLFNVRSCDHRWLFISLLPLAQLDRPEVLGVGGVTGSCSMRSTVFTSRERRRGEPTPPLGDDLKGGVGVQWVGGAKASAARWLKEQV